MSEQIGMNIRIYRVKAGLSQKGLAEKAGLSVHTISKYEQGKSDPSIGNLQKIAAALEVGIEKLFEG